MTYQCRRTIETTNAGMRSESTPQCRGRMVATWHVATRLPAVTCDACGRIAAAEVAA